MKLNYADKNIYDEEAMASRHYDPNCCDCNCCEPRKYCKPCDPGVSPCPYPILFDAAEGNKVYLPKADTALGTFKTKTAVSLFFDTSCLKSPFIKLDFSASIILDYKAPSSNTQEDVFFVSFELLKEYNGKTISLGTYEFNFATSDIIDPATANGIFHYEFPFLFTKLETNSQPAKSTYSVVINDVSISNLGTATIVNKFSVENPVLCAIAKSSI